MCNDVGMCLVACRYQAVGYASRQLASACPLVASDLLDLLLPHHEKAFFKACGKALWHAPLCTLIDGWIDRTTHRIHLKIISSFSCACVCDAYRYQAVGYASRQLASACPVVASDLLDLLLPHHEKAFFRACEKAMTPAAILAHPSHWKSLAKAWRLWEDDMKRAQGKETSEAREKEEQDSEEEDVVERVCRRPGCGKVRTEVVQCALGKRLCNLLYLGK